MHIIVDIREAHPLMRDTELLWEVWGNIWRSYFPHDTLTYLIFDTQIKKDNSYISVPHGSGSWWKKRLIAQKNTNEIFRCVNFSIYAPYDKHIPTLTHIFDHRAWLYPRESESSFLGKKNIERRYQHIYKESHKVIVPSMDTGLESMELWGVKESKLEVIPYFSLFREGEKMKAPVSLDTAIPFFLYDGVLGSESKILDTLKGFEIYKQKWGANTLIIHGYFSDELSNVIQIIRTLDLTEYVKIAWVLSKEERAWLYRHAQAWLMLSGYYSAWPAIEMAYHAWLPMILSDIPISRNYSEIRIHPNHIIDELPGILRRYEKRVDTKKIREYTEKDIMTAYKNYLSEGFGSVK